jgi:hypothetical protein
MNTQPTASVHVLTFKLSPLAGAGDRLSRADAMRLIVNIRRSARRVTTAIAACSSKANGYRRQARILKAQQSPFDAARIASLESTAGQISATNKVWRQTMIDMGKLLRSVSPMVDDCTTLAERCNALNINAADRSGLTEADGLCDLIFVHALEDSAERRGSEYNDGPLFNVMHSAFADFLHTPAGERVASELFDSMFADVPMYTRAPDGTITRQPPRLRSVPATTTSQGHA